jgi:hypothetical protein
MKTMMRAAISVVAAVAVVVVAAKVMALTVMVIVTAMTHRMPRVKQKNLLTPSQLKVKTREMVHLVAAVIVVSQVAKVKKPKPVVPPVWKLRSSVVAKDVNTVAVVHPS